MKQFIENEDQNFKMFNYLNELTSEIEKGEEALAELKLESDKFKGADKGAASQRKRLVKDLQERVEEVEGRTKALDEYNKHTTGTIAQVSRSIEGLCAKLGANTTLLQEMGAEGGANESNLMVYLGVLEQRANELLSGYLSLSGGGGHSGRYDEPGTPGGSGLLVGRTRRRASAPSRSRCRRRPTSSRARTSRRRRRSTPSRARTSSRRRCAASPSERPTPRGRCARRHAKRRAEAAGARRRAAPLYERSALC